MWARLPLVLRVFCARDGVVDRISAALGTSADTIWNTPGATARSFLWVVLGRLGRRVDDEANEEMGPADASVD
jgi:hypothetical protein